MRRLLSSKGFTLIELLIVISIIVILIAIGAVSYTTAQQKARNGQRQSDLQKISAALEEFFADYHEYPSTQALMKSCLEGTSCSISAGSLPPTLNVYLRNVPTDPQVTSTDYVYVPTLVGGSAQSYTLSATGFEGGSAPTGYNPLRSPTH